ncbi:MAG TPA: TetR/AcrR family transcriptional regulator [Nocardioidaceae bacterium]|nr:TetR/AcrR family transcriptional regulator [Nocardioidaceae bacterium]
MTPVERLDRRAPAKGDARREALLEALASQLSQGASLDTLNVADITRQAGVTRSAFYFYFENKAYAVAALMGEVYDGAAAASDALMSREGTPRERLSRMLNGLFDVIGSHQHLYRAMLEARGTDEAVRRMWDADRDSFIEPVADLIRAERAAGRAPDGADASALATVLLDLNDRALERWLSGTGPERDTHLDALVSVWLRSIYGSSSESTEGDQA